MLKDEASWSREKMSKIDITEVIKNVVDDFKQDLKNQNKKISINIKKKYFRRMAILFWVLKIDWNKS